MADVIEFPGKTPEEKKKNPIQLAAESLVLANTPFILVFLTDENGKKPQLCTNMIDDYVELTLTRLFLALGKDAIKTESPVVHVEVPDANPPA